MQNHRQAQPFPGGAAADRADADKFVRLGLFSSGLGLREGEFQARRLTSGLNGVFGAVFPLLDQALKLLSVARARNANFEQFVVGNVPEIGRIEVQTKLQLIFGHAASRATPAELAKHGQGAIFLDEPDLAETSDSSGGVARSPALRPGGGVRARRV